MSNLPGPPPSRKRLLAFVFIAGALVATAFYYRFHLLWLMSSMQSNTVVGEALTTNPMPETPVPRGWTRIQHAGVEFSLPDDLAASRTAAGEGGTRMQFTDGSLSILAVASELEMQSVYKLVSVPTELRSLTLPKLRLACYQAESRDFRWSMTSDEVRHHLFYRSGEQLLRLMSTGRVEYFIGGEVDGVIHFDGQIAICDWETKDRAHSGYIHFVVRKKSEIDTTFVRAVCNSLAVIPRNQSSYDNNGKYE